MRPGRPSGCCEPVATCEAPPSTRSAGRRCAAPSGPWWTNTTRLVSEALGQLHPASAGIVTAMAALADDIRGYEDVKRRNIDRFRARAAELVAELGAVEVADDSYRHHHMAG